MNGKERIITQKDFDTLKKDFDTLKKVVDALIASSKTQREGFSTGDVRELHEGIKTMLKRVRDALENVIPSFIVLDENCKVVDAWILGEKESDLKGEDSVLEPYRMSLLGYSFVNSGKVKEKKFWKRVFKKADKHSKRGESLRLVLDACLNTPRDGGRDSKVKTLEAIYKVSEIDAGDKEQQWGKYPLHVAQGINVARLTSAGVKLQRLLLVTHCSQKLPQLPKIYSISIFMLNQSCGDSKSESELIDRIPTDLIAWAAQTSAFLSQLYALSQASVQDLRRISDELQVDGWTSVLKDCLHASDAAKKSRESNAIHSRLRLPIEGAIAYVLNLDRLNLDRSLIRSRILREIAKDDKGAITTFAELTDYIQFLQPGDSDLQKVKVKDKVDFLKKYLSVYYEQTDTDTKSGITWKDILCNLAMASLREIYRFYPAVARKIPGELNIFWDHTLLPTISSIFKDNTKYLALSLSAIDEWVTHMKDYPNLHKWGNIYKYLKKAAKQIQPSQMERLLVTILLCVEHSSEEYLAKFESLSMSITSAWMKTNAEKRLLETATVTFSLISEDRQRSVQDAFQMARKPMYDLFTEKVRRKAVLKGPEVLAVISGKGGTGKTTIALALGANIAQQEANRVCIIDLDFFGPSLAHVVGATDLGDCVYLNDYAWIHARQDSATGVIKANMEGILATLRGRQFLEARFDRLKMKNGTKDDRLIKDLCCKKWEKVQVISSSPNEVLQDAMQPLLDFQQSQGYMSTILLKLIGDISAQGFTHIIIDTPAELKEVTMIATDVCNLYGGKNVFVATLARSSIEPIARMLGSGKWSNAHNYLLINRARKLDIALCSNKEVFIDYWSTQVDSLGPGWNSLSYTALDFMLPVEKCGYCPWLEDLERLYQHEYPFDHRVYTSLMQRDLQECLAFLF